MGLIFGLFVNERIEKIESGHEDNLKVMNTVRNSSKIQSFLHFLGFAVMLLTYLLIIPYLPVV